MIDRCQGSNSLRTPTLAIKICPECKKEVEIFSNEVKAVCTCGFVIFNDIVSCVQWCKYAKECVGEEVFKKLVEKDGQ